MTIRKATENDVNAIKQLYWALDGDAVYYQPEHFLRTERPEQFILDIVNSKESEFLLIESDDKVIGFSLIQEKETSGISCLKHESYAYILDFVIAKDHRSRGYGTNLFEASKQWAKSRGLDFLRLSVFPANRRGIKFYEGQGLKEKMKTMECPL